MHTFRAITPCVVLDVFGPPYLKDDRDCTYYRDHPYSSYSGKQHFAKNMLIALRTIICVSA